MRSGMWSVVRYVVWPGRCGANWSAKVWRKVERGVKWSVVWRDMECGVA